MHMLGRDKGGSAYYSLSLCSSNLRVGWPAATPPPPVPSYLVTPASPTTQRGCIAGASLYVSRGSLIEVEC